MNTIISKYEYDALLRKHLKRNLYSSSLALILIALLEFIVIWLVLTFTDDLSEGIDRWFILLLPVVFLIISLFLYIAAKRIDRKEVAHFSFTLYDEYESEGTKVPLYRIVQRGKNSESIYTMMILYETSI